MEEGRSTQVDVPSRALDKTDKFSSPHFLEDEIFLVQFSSRMSQFYVGGSQFDCPLSAVPWAYLLSCPSYCILNPLLLRLTSKINNFSPRSSFTLWFSAPFGLFPGSFFYFLWAYICFWDNVYGIYPTFSGRFYYVTS